MPTLSPAIKLQFETALIVFVSSFLVTFGSSLNSLNVSTVSWSIVSSIIVTAVGIAARAVYTSWFNNSLGAQIKTGAVK